MAAHSPADVHRARAGDICGDGSIIKTIVKEGAGNKPPRGAECTVLVASAASVNYRAHNLELSTPSSRVFTCSQALCWHAAGRHQV